MAMRTILLLAILLAIGSQSNARADLILNPSFEDPVLANPGNFQRFFTGSTIGSGWVVQGPAASVVIHTPLTAVVAWPNATEGNQILYVGDNMAVTTVYQDLSLNSNTSYLLQFDLGAFTTNPVNGNGAALLVDVVGAGGSLLPSPTLFTRPFEADFATQSLVFTTTNPGNYRLSITTQQNFGTSVDNFQLTAVPEPSSITILSSGLVFAAVRRFRKRRTTR